MSTSLAQLYGTLRSALDQARRPAELRDVTARLRGLFDQIAATVQADPDDDDRTVKQRVTLNEVVRAAVMAGLAVRTPAPASAPVPLPAAAPSGIMHELTSFFRGGRNERITIDHRSPAVPEPTVDVTELGEKLRLAYELVDGVLELAAPPEPVEVTVPWSADVRLLELFQDLLEAQMCGDGTLALSHVERLRRALPLEHGVEIVTYTAATAGMFKRVTPDVDGDVPRTVRPALAVDGRAVHKGAVAMPKGASDADHEEEGGSDV